MFAQSTELRVFSTNDQSFTHSISWLQVDRRVRKPCCCFVIGSETSDLFIIDSIILQQQDVNDMGP